MNLRLYFIAYVFILLFLTVAATAVLFGVLNFYMFTRPASFSLMIWMLLVSIALGTGITAFFSKKNPLAGDKALRRHSPGGAGRFLCGARDG